MKNWKSDDIKYILLDCREIDYYSVKRKYSHHFFKRNENEQDNHF